jgi:hypothetical protein
VDIDIDSSRQPRSDAVVQIDARLFPLPLHGTFGNAPQSGNLCEGKTTEEFQVHDLG